MLKAVAPLLCVAALLACLMAGPAVAADAGWLGIVDAGPAVVLGSGGDVYPADLTFKLLPIGYDEPIPTDDWAEMLEGAFKYTLAHAGVDVLFADLSSFENVVYGASLPVVNTIAGLPARLGASYIQDVGPRGFLRLDLIDVATGGSAEETALAATLTLATLDHIDRLDRLRIGSLPTFAAPIIPQTDRPTLTLSWAGDSVGMVYGQAF